jgi:hypothetical protein
MTVAVGMTIAASVAMMLAVLHVLVMLVLLVRLDRRPCHRVVRPMVIVAMTALLRAVGIA